MDDVGDDDFSMRLTLATSSDRGNGVLDSERMLCEETSNVLRFRVLTFRFFGSRRTSTFRDLEEKACADRTSGSCDSGIGATRVRLAPLA